MEYIVSCEDEKKYLENYDPNRWPKASVTVDNAIFAYENKKLYILLVKRGNYPYKGSYALPGGFIDMDEDLIDSARRELFEETGLSGVYLSQASMWGKPGRDPRDRTVTALFMTLLDRTKVKPVAGDDAAETVWFEVKALSKKESLESDVKAEEYSLLLTDGKTTLVPKIIRKTAYREYKEFSEELSDRGDIAFDHGLCIINAYLQLKDEIMRTDISYGVLGREFDTEKMLSLFKAVLKDDFNSETEEELNRLLKSKNRIFYKCITD